MSDEDVGFAELSADETAAARACILANAERLEATCIRLGEDPDQDEVLAVLKSLLAKLSTGKVN